MTRTGFWRRAIWTQVPPAANETDSTESLTDTTGVAKVTFGNDVPANLSDVDCAGGYRAALDTQLTTLAGNPVVFALEAATGDLVGKDGSTEVIRIHITGASLTNAATGEVSYTYSTTLSQPIKHASLDGQPGDNSENSALLSGVTFEVTDKDTSTTQGTFNVTIVDDVPVQTAGTEAKTVYEDLLAGGNPDTPANPVGAATVATGTLAALVSFGADQPGTFSLSQNTASLPALTSKGVALSYSVSGLTLTGFVDLGVAGGVFEAGVDRPVFTLTLSGTNNATYTFTLLDQLDHLGGNLSGAGDDQIKTIDFSSMLVATDADLDQVALDAGSLLITVEDDLPINNATSVTGAVDEDSLPTGNLDAVNVGTVAGGSLAGLVTVGADEPATFGFAGSFAGLTAQALTSKGAALSYSVSGLTLTGFVDLGVAGGAFEVGTDRPVFTLTLSGTNNATYTFTLLDQLDHQGGNLSGAGDDQIKTIDFSSMLVATDADLDQVALDAGSLLITVEDDLPINNATSVTGAVDEDSLPTGNLDAVNVGTVAGGSLAGLVTVGADEPATFGFAGSFAGLTAQALTSKGAALSYSVSGLTLTGFVDLGVAGGVFEAGVDRPVFTLTLSGTNNATYTFTLLDQLDHQGGNLSGAGDDQIKTIDFSSMLVATDADLDQVALDAGSLLITVEDDLPINNATSVTGAVDEDSLNNVSGAFGSLGNLDAVNVGTVAGGSLAGLVTVGADEPATTFGFTGSFAGLTAQALTSKGVALSYSVSGLMLIGFVDLGVAGGAFEVGTDRPVFTLTLSLSGTNNATYTFTLLDQLDHQGGNLSGAGDDQIKTIDFSSMLVATDADLDQVALDAGSLLITVEDDLPINNATSVTGAVDEDSLNNVSGAFGSLGNLDAVNVGTVAGGSLAGLVTVGADEPATFGFAGSFAGLTAQALTSKGVALSYSVSGLTLTGFVDLGVAGGAFEVGTDRPVFTLTLSGTNNATYTFTLLDQLDHQGGNLSGAGDDQIKTIDFSSMLVATDADLDQVALDAGSLLITVEDDLPINNATSVTGAVDEDSLNNVSGAFGSLGNLDAVNVGTVAGGSLAGLVTVGADEPATFGFAGSFAGLTAQALTSQGGGAELFGVRPHADRVRRPGCCWRRLRSGRRPAGVHADAVGHQQRDLHLHAARPARPSGREFVRRR